MTGSTDCSCALVKLVGPPELVVKAAIAWTSWFTREAANTVPSLSWNLLSWLEDTQDHPFTRTLSVLPVPRSVTTRSAVSRGS